MWNHLRWSPVSWWTGWVMSCCDGQGSSDKVKVSLSWRPDESSSMNECRCVSSGGYGRTICCQHRGSCQLLLPERCFVLRVTKPSISHLREKKKQIQFSVRAAPVIIMRQDPLSWQVAHPRWWHHSRWPFPKAGKILHKARRWAGSDRTVGYARRPGDEGLVPPDIFFSHDTPGNRSWSSWWQSAAFGFYRRDLWKVW